MSLGERPASAMARRADSAATIRSECSDCGPATTPRPTIAYCPEDACLGTTVLLPLRCLLFAASPGARGSRFWGGDQVHACARSRREAQLAALDLDAGERIIEQAIELAELARIVGPAKCAGEMQGVGGEEPAADSGAEPVADMPGLAYSG